MKKLIPALTLLLISAILVGSSTFAWFSMNTSVSATGMTVTAKSNSTYLLIADAEDVVGDTDPLKAASIQTGALTTVAASHTAATVYPAAYNNSASAITVVTENDVAANTWYTASSEDPASPEAAANVTMVTVADDNYMLTNTFYLTLSQDSEPYAGDLKVTLTRKSGADAAVSAVVIIGDNTYNLTDTVVNGQFTLAEDELTSQTVIPVTVYTYVNGNSGNVYSDYINSPEQTITGEIELAFELVATTEG
jgi:hypothetical protein